LLCCTKHDQATTMGPDSHHYDRSIKICSSISFQNLSSNLIRGRVYSDCISSYRKCLSFWGFYTHR
jgi:hypothetical protein